MLADQPGRLISLMRFYRFQHIFMDRKGNIFGSRKALSMRHGNNRGWPASGSARYEAGYSQKKPFHGRHCPLQKSPFITGIRRFLLALQDFMQLPEEDSGRP